MTIETIEEMNFEKCSKDELLAIKQQADVELEFGSYNLDTYKRWYKIYDRVTKTLEVYFSEI